MEIFMFLSNLGPTCLDSEKKKKKKKKKNKKKKKKKQDCTDSKKNPFLSLLQSGIYNAVFTRSSKQVLYTCLQSQ